MESKNTNAQETTKLWEDFRNGRAYQSGIRLTENVPMYVRFYEGDQWPPPTERTMGLPRPVVNFIKMICRIKKAAILSTPVKIHYNAERDGVDVESFNRFSEYILKEIKQSDIDKKAVDSGVKKGSYFYHYFWDSEARGLMGSHRGGVRCELIDVLNIFFSDPTEDDEQKQEWILIASREPVSSVRAKCDNKKDRDLIVSDDALDDPYAIKEQEGSELVTVLTRYFRRNGEVWIERATKNVIINKPFPLTPDLDAARKALNTTPDAPNNDLPDQPEGERNLVPKRAKATLYPIVVGNYEPREKCIYGLGEVAGLIQNQRSVNFTLGILLLAVQDNGWGKYIVDPNALKGQVITNEAGQVLVDYSGTGNGIRRLAEHNMPTAPMAIIESIMQLSRSVTGATEVMTGETIGSNMSGAAIAQLQAQAMLPVDDLKETFWKVKEQQGRVLAQFYKLFYRNKEYSYTEDPKNGGDKPERQTATFNGAEFADVDFEVTVEAVGGTHASAAGDIQALETALMQKAISVKTFFELYPKDALSNRSEILERLENEESNMVATLQMQIAQLTEQIGMRDQQLAAQQKTVDEVAGVIRENQNLKTMLAQLYSEASAKIVQANQVLAASGLKLQEIETDARIMAADIAARHDNQSRSGKLPI